MRQWLVMAGLIGSVACRSDAPAPRTSSTAAVPVQSAAPVNAKVLGPGDPVPAVVVAGARHWTRGGAAGSRILVITFTRTRCPEDDPCAALERKLRSLQDAVQDVPGLKSSVGLLTLSVDPAFDVPAVLRAHADHIGADAEVWRFAALPASQVDDVVAQFGSSSTAIVDAGGKLVKLYGADAWSADDMLRDLQSLVLRADPAVVSAYVAAQEALAADELGGARRALARLSSAVGEPAVSRLAAAAAGATDLAGIRAAFKPLSEALVRLPWPPEYQAMYCPMFDGNNGATWVQKAGPVRNPYYGAAMLRCGTDLSAGAHADHSPKYGGVLFMAADAFHHVEGTYTPDGLFRVRVYDNFRRSMKVSGFRARGVLKEELDPRTQNFRELVTFRFVPAADGMTLDARVGTIAFPAEITLKITLDPRGGEERFDFVFADFSPRNPGT